MFREATQKFTADCKLAEPTASRRKRAKTEAGVRLLVRECYLTICSWAASAGKPMASTPLPTENRSLPE